MTASALPGPGQYSIYTGRATNWPLVVIFGIALTVPLLTLGGMSHGAWLDPSGPAIALLVAAAAVLVTALTGLSVRTAAGPNGVSVHCGAFGWPRRTYRLTDIDHVEVTNLSPLWGLILGHWWTPDHTAFTVRTGPALRLIMHSGRRITITVPDPDAAARTIQEAKSA
ncbi:hypothetical protein AMES_5445 [Amycolatopsis mediterranei S699]|uniref:Lipoprotein n=2 Tax=Amycolatopsis mediterranei TaxID=33910 RepID=A0A0H3D8G9_AMYMU|nr:hypothetical protein [Amycolatopsis mediterranei]ADJ47270.1 conserved hypothetical protein [Amycolatopsis mediterranei U32]AEK44095.1 hypothetical protein RAM_28090 [Amycolatopsis mediterranei S699]AFO78981.1 hypothetical protein AMES_5445 [Amycolatopsis mediterranei S699]AGT86109.1 hypothetical protein B737_5445 [Amycolatopsis mediterranei RB]KDO04768.1 hypothetical protein DV26_41935 [Amycolatopsis mediterranei]